MSIVTYSRASRGAHIFAILLSMIGIHAAAQTATGVFGISNSGLLYHVDGGQTGGFAYLCVNGDCRSVAKVAGRYERQLSPANTSGVFAIEFKVQDNATGQCIANASVNYGGAVASSPCYSGAVSSAAKVSSVATSSIPASSKAASSVAVQSSIAVQSSMAVQSSGAASSRAVVTGGEFGLQADGLVYHLNGGHTAGFVYLCLNGNCQTPALVNGRYQRNFGTVSAGTLYSIEFKVQDNAIGQCLASANVIAGQAVVSNCYTGTPASSVASSNPNSSKPVSSSSSVLAISSKSNSSIAALSSSSIAVVSSKSSSSLAAVSSIGISSAAASLESSNTSSSTSSAIGDANFGIEKIDATTALYWVADNPAWSRSGDYYSCKNADADCYRAELKNGRWERVHNNMQPGSYKAVLKIPGMGSDQYPTLTFSWAGGGNTTSTSTSSSGSGSVGTGGTRIIAPSLNPEIYPALDIQYDLATKSNYLAGGLHAPQFFGRTLYTFANDTAGVSNCSGGCATNWPPLIVRDVKALLPMTNLRGALATIKRADGNLQVTYKGMPLYFYAADQVPGERKGEGAGNVWFVANADLVPVAAQLFQHALQTPSNMSVSQNGFAFSLDANKVNFQFGTVLAEVSAPGVSFFCSTNQMDFSEVSINNGSATIPNACSSATTYWYFFRYKMKSPGAGKYVMSDSHAFDPDSAYQYTALFINDGTRLDLTKRAAFDDTGANWMRFRHPRAYDGVTEAIRDATHNSSRLAELARYSIHAIESTNANSSIDLTLDLNLPEKQGLVRLEGLENGAGDEKLPTWRYQFEPSNGQRTYHASGWSYGQSLSFEMTGVVGAIGSQTYNTYQYYTFGLGFHSPIGDPRLALVGKGGTYMQFNIKNYGGEYKNGHIGAGINDVIMEKAAIFTQHLTTLHDPKEVDDFLWGHHLFHGVKLQRATAEMPSQENLGSNPGDTGIGREIPELKKGAPIACGDCHYRDGRGSDVIDTAFGKRIAPPVFGVGLLQYIEGREAGFAWNGKVPTVRQQIKNALVADHHIDPNNAADITPENLELISRYTEFLTVPTRFAGVYEQAGVTEGDKLFRDIGCAGCHQPIQKTSSYAPEKFRNLTIRPYTDMKVHKVADGTYRTAPLWGLGRNIDLLENNNKLVAGDLAMGIALYGGSKQAVMDTHHMRTRPLLFLHDGRATSLRDAIVKHKNTNAITGDADASVNKFSALSTTEQNNILRFLRSL